MELTNNRQIEEWHASLCSLFGFQSNGVET